MTQNNFPKGKSTLIIVGLALAVLVGLFLVFNNYIYKTKQITTNNFEPYRATLTGVQTCLPHKDTEGPQTLECAIGMKTDTGEYYVLDLNLMSQSGINISDGERFTASGVITPIERLNTDQWQKYNVKGIFSVTDSVIKSVSKGAPVFLWKMEDDDTKNGDGNPNTNIFLVLKYSSGEMVSKLIDTVDGGCSVQTDADADSAPGSTVLQCYYAGFGELFKVIKTDSAYQVMKKEFEEGSPDYNPPVQKYKVIAEFPF